MSVFITRLITLFGEPKTEHPDAYIREYREALKRFDDAVQKRGSDELIRNHRMRVWPTVAECIRACEEAMPKPPPKRLHQYADWTDEAIARADELVRGDMGRTAAAEGWHVGLHDFCRHHGRLPSGWQIETIKREARDFAAAYAAVGSVGIASLRQRLMDLGNSMLAKRDRMARDILGGTE